MSGKSSCISQFGNSILLLAVLAILATAFIMQFTLNELPCPLCLLQRVGFVGIAFGFLLNIRFGARASHYAVVILSCLYTAAVGLRQVALHVVPNTGAYGSPIFGYHLYTLSFIAAAVFIFLTAILMSCDKQYEDLGARKCNPYANYLFILAVIIIAANIVSAVFECGLSAACPDDPVKYLLL